MLVQIIVKKYCNNYLLWMIIQIYIFMNIIKKFESK